MRHAGNGRWTYRFQYPANRAPQDCSFGVTGRFSWLVTGSLCNTAGCTTIQGASRWLNVTYLDPETSPRFHKAERIAAGYAARVARLNHVRESNGYCDMPNRYFSFQFACHAEVTRATRAAVARRGLRVGGDRHIPSQAGPDFATNCAPS